MTSTYAWLGETPSVFSLRLETNQRSFVSPYSPTSQTADLIGDRWVGRIDLPASTSRQKIRAREAWANRLRGQANRFSIWHFTAPTPLGTIGTTAVVSWTDSGSPVSWTDSGSPVTWTDGTPVLRSAVAQLANTAALQILPSATVKAGDMLGLPNGQAVQVLADAAADSTGAVTVEFAPRARTAMSAYGAIVTTRPTITVMLRTVDGAPVTTYQPGFAEGCTLEFVEALS